MSEIIAVVLAAALADNILFAKMLGLCPFINLSKRVETAAGIGAATFVVLTVSCMAAWALNAALPDSWAALRPLLFIAVVACLVQVAEILTRLAAPLLHRRLGVFLPLIATNCAVLGVMLLAVRDDAGFAAATARGVGGGAGFFLAVVCMALLRQRIVESEVPAAMRGAPLALVGAGLMALTFSGLLTPG